MRNGGLYRDDDLSNCAVSLVVPNDPAQANTGRPAIGGYRYDNSSNCQSGQSYGAWVRLTDDCRRRLCDEFKNAENLDILKVAREKVGTKLKDVKQQIDPDVVDHKAGGDHIQLPIAINEYEYFNVVADRLPFSLEKGFQITATRVAESGDFSGRVAHLDQIFFWRREQPDCPQVQFDLEDFLTWETDIRGLPSVRRYTDDKGKEKIEFPTTHLWTDFDKYEMAWFYHKRCVARKTFVIPWLLQKPLDWAINWGLKKLIKGEAFDPDGEEER